MPPWKRKIYTRIVFSEENKKPEPFSYWKKVRIFLIWWAMRDSNPQLTGYEPVALTVKLMARKRPA